MRANKERQTDKIRGALSGMHRALDDCMWVGAPTSLALGLHHHGSRHSNFPYFCMMYGLEKLRLLIKTDWSVICRFVAENAGRR